MQFGWVRLMGWLEQEPNPLTMLPYRDCETPSASRCPICACDSEA
jgi:hypothetical protein